MICPHCGKEIPLLIESGTLKKCLTKADHIEIPDFVDTIEDEAFMFSGRIKTVHFAPGCCLDYIGESAFAQCVHLVSINLPDQIDMIDCEAFAECSALQSIILPEGLTRIEEKTFYQCKALTSVTIPSTIEIIQPHAFALCSSLSEIELPEGLLNIGDDAFHSSGLTHITLPGTLKEIGASVFKHCKELKEIRFNGTVGQWQKIKRKEQILTIPVTCIDGQIDWNS